MSNKKETSKTGSKTVIQERLFELNRICRHKDATCLPKMVRVRELASFLYVSDCFLAGVCEKIGVTIIRAGKRKIRMVSRDDFFKKTEKDGRQ